MTKCIIARQPIFDNKLRIYGYELLFRGYSSDATSAFDPDQATSSVLADSMFLIGLKQLVSEKLAFVNFSGKMLMSDVMTLLPNKQIAIEILETVNADEKCVAACKKLKESGYKIVLDDFIYHPTLEPLVAIADIIKVDFLSSPASYCESIPKRFKQRNDIIFLAEKVETYEQYLQAVKWGYTLFQGYFFCKPVVLNTQDIKGNKLVYFQLLKALNDPAITIDQLAKIIEKDVALSYKVLKYINSAAFGIRIKINSIKHALALMGSNNLEKLVTIVLLKGLGDDKPDELIVTATIRGRFAELIAGHMGLTDKSKNAFLVGMLSLIEALVDQPIAKILKELPLSDDISESLQRQPNTLTSILEMLIAYEQASWDKYIIYRQMLGLQDDEVKKMYMESISWAWSIKN